MKTPAKTVFTIKAPCNNLASWGTKCNFPCQETLGGVRCVCMSVMVKESLKSMIS